MTTTPSNASPQKIVDLAIGFMASQQLVAASRIGLFSAISKGANTPQAIAEATGTPERQVRTLADSMNANGLLERSEGSYSLAPDAAAYLTGEDATLDLTPFIAFLGDISYKQWLGYGATVDTDEAGTLDLDEAGWGRFMAGVMTYNELHASQLATAFDFSGYSSLLDLGGLSPSFAVQALQANAGLSADFWYDPSFTDAVTQAAGAAGVNDRVSVTGADTVSAEPGGEHDLVMVNHVLHRFDAEQNAQILAHARRAATPGATLLVLDFYLDDNERQRPIDALHAGEYYNIDGTVVYPTATVESWLSETGWRAERYLELDGSPRVLVATAV